MELRPGERIDDLQLDGLHILQKKDGFRFGMDAVLLADFTRTRPRECIADLGTGTGILSLLLSHQQPDTQFEAIELQPDMADMAGRSVELNGLSDRIHVHAMDLRQAPEAFGYEKFHAVVCNPPYGKQNGTLKSQTETVSLARHEQDTSIGEIVKSAGALLRTMGRLTMVFPAQRFLELCDELRRCRLEPKRVRMVCAKLEKPPYLVLVESMKNARPGLHWMPPLVVYDPQGRETAEIERIYHKG